LICKLSETIIELDGRLHFWVIMSICKEFVSIKWVWRVPSFEGQQCQLLIWQSIVWWYLRHSILMWAGLSVNQSISHILLGHWVSSVKYN
jgi:hypothetical protein